jgi:hypothetical protein
LSAAAYSIYLLLTSIAGGHSSNRNPRTHHAVGTGQNLEDKQWDISVTLHDVIMGGKEKESPSLRKIHVGLLVNRRLIYSFPLPLTYLSNINIAVYFRSIKYETL